MKRKPLYVLFYTVNTPYADEAAECVKTLREFKLDYHIYPVHSEGSWEKNTQIKAKIIQQALKSTDRPIVYVDADARIKSYPILLDQIECDVAFHYFRGVELLSGTLYFGNTERGRKLVDEWVAENAKYPGEWDQKVLQHVVEKQHDIEWLMLPEEYVYVSHLSSPIKTPIIFHTQASRRLKSEINATA